MDSIPDQSHGHAKGCDSDCGACSMDQQAEQTEEFPYRGWPVVFGSLGMFIGPLILAISGALIWHESRAGQLAGGVIGLFAGMCLAGFIGKLICRSHKDGV